LKWEQKIAYDAPVLRSNPNIEPSMRIHERIRVISLLACMFGFGLPGTLSAAQIAGPLAAPSENTAKPTRIRVSANIPRVTTQTPPVYPQAAIDQRVEGNVVLHLIIGGDGAVKELTSVSGLALLSESAIEVVRSWKYQPVRLNGSPVEVDTTVTLSYSLGPPPTVTINNQPSLAISPAAGDPAQP